MPRMCFKINVDVTKLDKARFFNSSDGSIWADLTVFCNPDEMLTKEDVYVITQDMPKSRRVKGEEDQKVGWFKCTWREETHHKNDENDTPRNSVDRIPF